MASVTVTKTDALAAATHVSAGSLSEAAQLTAPAPPAAVQPPAAPSEPAPREPAAPSAPAAPRKPVESAGASNSSWWLRPLIALAAIAAVLIGWAIIVRVTHDPSTNFSTFMPKPVNGTTIFAVFFVTAAAIERFLEPIAGLLPDKSDLRKDAQTAKVNAGMAVARGQSDRSVQPMLDDAARKAIKAKDWGFGQTVGFWALATILSIVASALLKLYLPYVVGIASGSRGFQILATGLIIGGGTKPLHDLVGYMSAAKEAKQAAR